MDFISGYGFAREGYPVRALFSIPFTGLDEHGLPTFEINGEKVNSENYSDINFRSLTILTISSMRALQTLHLMVAWVIYLPTKTLHSIYSLPTQVAT